MMENKYKKDIFNEKYRHFGGIIYPSDFQISPEHHYMSDIVSRILSDQRWEKSIYKRAISFNNYQKGEQDESCEEINLQEN